VVALCIVAQHGGAVECRSSVAAVSARGLVGDRYFHLDPSAADHDDVTLIEAEAIDAVAVILGRELPIGITRRNIVTRGIRLNDLVGRELTVGPVRMVGTDRCDPCMHLEKLSVPGLSRALVGRGGLRATVIVGGTLSVGDPIRVEAVGAALRPAHR
jgi:MOSC domain-containing protein YiiM